ncbi:hypothetical protein HF520_06520 [Romboutsia sp. CE17]|uniref:hypothetical protein n=1 Tax=Romboutsia sp. CE17 TaxID=2724150 RepID=UPI001442DC89|nr:hypothetical protein [Romboutsia sp. CE17]QJA08616.1 hypothetical protein HF520_06520 [Romboutsia sp. CE17]
MKNKVDKGFELIYWNLSYRRKFIRTLWQTPLVFLAIGLLIFVGKNLFFNRIAPILLVIIYIWQLIYNYIKWKKDEEV